MKFIVSAMVTVVLWLASAATAHLPKHQPVATMTPRQLERFQLQVIAHDNSVIRFFHRHPWLRDLPFTREKARAEINFHRAQKIWTLRELVQTRHWILVSSRPPHYDEWLCIHSYEGPWDDPNAPYYGGLQMDMEFMIDYGKSLLHRKGTADNWTPLEQMWVAEKAYSSGRGFYPWPNTAHYCHLI